MKTKKITVYCEFCLKSFELSIKYKGIATCPYCGIKNDDIDKSSNKKIRKAVYSRRINRAIKEKYPSAKIQKAFKALDKSLKKLYKKEYAEVLLCRIKLMLVNGEKENVLSFLGQQMTNDILKFSGRD